MATSLHRSFVADLVGVGDASFAGRVLRKLFDDNGRFIDQAKEDHRYKGIADAWIRKASKGMRIIYIRNGKQVVIYRAGQHSVEDNLEAPADLEGLEVVDSSIEEMDGEVAAAMVGGVGMNVQEHAKATEAFTNASEEAATVGSPASRLLYNHIDRFLYGNLIGRRYLPHKDVYLVSPYLSADLLRSTDRFGQMLDELIEGGASVWLVTRPPASVSGVAMFERLAARGISVFFNSALHAKVFAFVLNRDQLKPSQQTSRDFVSVGSANLTGPGINPGGSLSKTMQYELTYEVTPEDWPDVEAFIHHVTGLSVDLEVFRSNLMAKAK